MPSQRRLLRSLFRASLIATIAVPLFAQYFGQNKMRYRTLEFQVLKTEHFDIYYYDETKDVIADIARMAERWYVRLSKVLNHQLSLRQPLILYANHVDFRGTTAIPGYIGETTGGVTEGLRRTGGRHRAPRRPPSSALVHRRNGRVPLSRTRRFTYRDVDARCGAQGGSAFYRGSGQSVRSGRAALSIYDAQEDEITDRIRFDEIGEIYNASWSPDGRFIGEGLVSRRPSRSRDELRRFVTIQHSCFAVGQLTYVHPNDRPRRNWMWQFSLLPGF